MGSAFLLPMADPVLSPSPRLSHPRSRVPFSARAVHPPRRESPASGGFAGTSQETKTRIVLHALGVSAGNAVGSLKISVDFSCPRSIYRCQSSNAVNRFRRQRAWGVKLGGGRDAVVLSKSKGFGSRFNLTHSLSSLSAQSKNRFFFAGAQVDSETKSRFSRAFARPSWRCYTDNSQVNFLESCDMLRLGGRNGTERLLRFL